jgi:AcrR family transcriptional regulator
MRDDEDERPWTRLGRFLRRVPRQERARSVVRAILEAADDGLELAEHGPLQPLFARAGVAAGSFYEYFASREALLSAVIERLTLRNFDAFVSEIDAILASPDASLERRVRQSAELIARRYLERPGHLRTVIRVADRLDLLGPIATERDRFADAIATRLAPHTPALGPEARASAVRAMADAGMGVVVVSLHRSPVPPVDEVAHAVGDVAWAILSLHLARA